MSLGKHILILVMLFIGAFNAFASDNDYIIYSTLIPQHFDLTLFISS